MTEGSQHMDVGMDPQHDDLADCLRDLAFLQRLTRSLANVYEHDEILDTFFAELSSRGDSDVIGMVRNEPFHVWVWSEPQQHVRAEALRDRLSIPYGRPEGRSGPGSSSRSHRHHTRQQRHLVLVPKSEDGHRVIQREGSSGRHEARMTLGPAIEGMLHIERDQERSFSTRERNMWDTVAMVLALAMGRTGKRRQWHESHGMNVLRDGFAEGDLNGLLHREMHAGYRYGVPSCLLLLDLDYFATVNIRLGHKAGDHILRSVAALVEENVREVDHVSRYGGETFAVVLPHTGLGQAEALAERIRAQVEQEAFRVDDGQVRLTTSIGLASCRHATGESVAGWIAAAESALSEAKTRGRNCVVTHAPSPHVPAQAALSLVA